MNAETGTARPKHDISWEPRRRMTLDAARKRSNMIRILRLSFLILSAVIIAVVALYILAHAINKETPPPPNVQNTDGEVRMINPRFSGRDGNGRPYVVIADTATRREDEPETTYLVNPRLDTEPGEESSQVTAKRGIYQANLKILNLYDDVVFFTPNGNTYKTGHAEFFIDTDTIVGDSPVKGTGPTGSVSADAYKVLNGGEKVTFFGNVITRIQGKKTANGESNE